MQRTAQGAEDLAFHTGIGGFTSTLVASPAIVEDFAGKGTHFGFGVSCGSQRTTNITAESSVSFGFVVPGVFGARLLTPLS